MAYSTWHFYSDIGRDDFQSFDEAIAWSLNAVRYCPFHDDEDNTVSIYCKDDPNQTDRIAVVYPGMVVVNEGHGTNKWPCGWNEINAGEA